MADLLFILIGFAIGVAVTATVALLAAWAPRGEHRA